MTKPFTGFLWMGWFWSLFIYLFLPLHTGSCCPIYGRAPAPPQGYWCWAGTYPTLRYHSWRAHSENRETPGIEPGTSRSPDERSTNWANWLAWGFIVKIEADIALESWLFGFRPCSIRGQFTLPFAMKWNHNQICLIYKQGDGYMCQCSIAELPILFQPCLCPSRSIQSIYPPVRCEVHIDNCQQLTLCYLLTLNT